MNEFIIHILQIGLTVWLVAVAAIVIPALVRERQKLRGFLSHGMGGNQVFAGERAPLALAAIGLPLAYLQKVAAAKAASVGPLMALPDIPDAWLTILGISIAAYVAGKAGRK